MNCDNCVCIGCKSLQSFVDRCAGLYDS